METDVDFKRPGHEVKELHWTAHGARRSKRRSPPAGSGLSIAYFDVPSSIRNVISRLLFLRGLLFEMLRDNISTPPFLFIRSPLDGTGPGPKVGKGVGSGN